MEPAAALASIRAHPAWAVLRLHDGDEVLLVGGPVSSVERLADVPVETSVPTDGRPVHDRLLAVPFRQVGERGFAAHDDGAPLQVVEIAERHIFALDELLAALPDRELTTVGDGGFETDDDAYAETVRAIIAEEIGRGEGANLVVGRQYRTRLADWDAEAALSVLRRLLERERGSYWTFCFFTGERYLVGATPERHVSVHAGEVRMNPISGTFRLGRDWGETSVEQRRQRLLDFLADEKEIYELFMVVDEELKMMCEVCHEGGQVLGPFLKPMTHLVHTEYLLAGRTRSDVRDVLRDTMYAATVTGSPVENACRLITRYEPEGRGYYGAALALLGRDGEGRQQLDSPILIRTAEVSVAGDLKVTAGATLVRDSDPVAEVAETHAKAGGILSAFGLVPPAPAAATGRAEMADLTDDDDVRIALGSRNQRLSRFWLTDQAGTAPDPDLKGRTVVVLDGEDEFVAMLGHLFGVLGMSTTRVRYDEWQPGALDGHDLVVVGPGPGDPRDGDHPKIATYRRVLDGLLASGSPFLAVCLGHQVLCDRLGLPLGYKDIVFQGTQADVDLFENDERVGFYNTFVARHRETSYEVAAGATGSYDVRVAADPVSGDVHAVAGPHFRGIQFHAESILTEHGVDIVRGLVRDLLVEG
ncbi:phenazine-specific anthranilate synthase component I [Nocardioides mangrovicus]|uniref:anthranilate synthase n=1 Tax=Nocardioides mangrovicus TaxID=2478913 RepID=A0A3L8P055_9ACTN|nr:anthranilate synthase family protein [Nocardioides mangrovicus]RLV47939.1 phenazine-specific anthranilate synthase component I [Nocardioides mangrovicus]